MTTQVIFKIDPKLKKAAQKKAAMEGRTLSSFLKSAMYSYANNELNYGLVIPSNIPVVKPTKRDLAEIKQAKQDLALGNYRSWSEVRDELDIKHNQRRR